KPSLVDCPAQGREKLAAVVQQVDLVAFAPGQAKFFMSHARIPCLRCAGPPVSLKAAPARRTGVRGRRSAARAFPAIPAPCARRTLVDRCDPGAARGMLQERCGAVV